MVNKKGESVQQIRRQIKLVSIVGVFVFSGSFAWADQLYKWVDASGSTHYSATPPPSTVKGKTKTITIATKKPKADVQVVDQLDVREHDSSNQNNSDHLEKMRRLKRTAIHGIDKDPSLRVSIAGNGTATLDDYNLAYKQRTGQDLFTKDKPVSKMSADEMASAGRKYMDSIRTK